MPDLVQGSWTKVIDKESGASAPATEYTIPDDAKLRAVGGGHVKLKIEMNGVANATCNLHVVKNVGQDTEGNDGWISTTYIATRQVTNVEVTDAGYFHTDLKLNLINIEPEVGIFNASAVKFANDEPSDGSISVWAML